MITLIVVYLHCSSFSLSLLTWSVYRLAKRNGIELHRAYASHSLGGGTLIWTRTSLLLQPSFVELAPCRCVTDLVGEANWLQCALVWCEYVRTLPTSCLSRHYREGENAMARLCSTLREIVSHVLTNLRILIYSNVLWVVILTTDCAIVHHLDLVIISL